MKVRALIDIAGTDIKCGEFFDGPDKLVKGLVKEGMADDKALETDVYGAGPIPPAKKIGPTPEASAQEEAEPEAKGSGK